MTQTTAPRWTKDNAEIFAQFLNSGTGAILVANVAEQRPALHPDTEDLNKCALRACRVAGFEECFKSFLAMSNPPAENRETTAVEAYPDLDLPEGSVEWKTKGAPAPSVKAP